MTARLREAPLEGRFRSANTCQGAPALPPCLPPSLPACLVSRLLRGGPGGEAAPREADGRSLPHHWQWHWKSPYQTKTIGSHHIKKIQAQLTYCDHDHHLGTHCCQIQETFPLTTPLPLILSHQKSRNTEGHKFSDK